MIKESNFAANTKFYFEASELNQLLNPAAILADQPKTCSSYLRCRLVARSDYQYCQAEGLAEERIHVERFTAKVPPPSSTKSLT